MTAASGWAGDAPARTGPPRLDEVFQSLKDSTQGDGISVPIGPLALFVAAAVMAKYAIKHWKRVRSAPRPLSSHRKLLAEAARASGISKRKLKRIVPLAQADGLSSPLVAIICPSAIKRLAKVVRTADEQEALKSLALGLFRSQERATSHR